MDQIDQARRKRKRFDAIGTGIAQNFAAGVGGRFRDYVRAAGAVQTDRWGKLRTFIESTAPIAGTVCEQYLRDKCALEIPPGVRLQFAPKTQLWLGDGNAYRLFHTGPAMLATLERAGLWAGASITWLDPAAPAGKVEAIHDRKTGALAWAEKLGGSGAGYHIDLTACQAPRELIIGVEIEDVLAVWTACSAAGRDLSTTGFWTSVDLDNLGGAALKAIAHPFLKDRSGMSLRVPGPEPDLQSAGIILPESVDRVVLLGDPNADAFTAQCVMARAAGRFARAGREVVVTQNADSNFSTLLRLGRDPVPIDGKREVKP